MSAPPTTSNPTTIAVADADIAAAILRQVTLLGADKSVSPSDIALILAQSLAEPEWRRHLGPIRRIAVALAREGAIDILRKGRPVDPAGVRGVIRLRIRPAPLPDEKPPLLRESGGDVPPGCPSEIL